MLLMLIFVQTLKLFFSNLLRYLLASAKDLTPIVLVVAFFQILVIGTPLPDLGGILVGSGLTLLGLALFIYGLELALFPIGESLAHSFVKKGQLWGLLSFSFLLGIGTTIAEPALIAVANKAAQVAQMGGILAPNAEATQSYAQSLRYVVASSVGFAVLLGVIRIIKGWSLVGIISTCYVVVIVLTIFAPEFIIGIAYDIGGVTTSTITVPLITALGVGLASSIAGRNPLSDGFGMIAIAAVLPIIAVLLFGVIREAFV